MASVKWLTGIYAVREPFCGYWQTSDYGYWDHADGKPVRRPLGEMKVKSEIFRPAVYERLAPNRPYTITGASWAGDAGLTWAKADFLDPARRYAWRRWKLDWITPTKSGQYTLTARARDAHGRVQPDQHDPNYGSYVIDHNLPIEVFVEEDGVKSQDGQGAGLDGLARLGN
jgi:hypothetical protein